MVKLWLVHLRLVRGFRLRVPGDFEVVVPGELVGGERVDLQGELCV